MGTMACQITSLTIVYSTVYSGSDQRKHQSSTSLAFVRRIHRGPVNSPHKWPVTRKMFPFDDVIMYCGLSYLMTSSCNTMRITFIVQCKPWYVHHCMATVMKCTRYCLWVEGHNYDAPYTHGTESKESTPLCSQYRLNETYLLRNSLDPYYIFPNTCSGNLQPGLCWWCCWFSNRLILRHHNGLAFKPPG